MSKWLHLGRRVFEESLPTDIVAFVYKIVDLQTDKLYIGKKHLTTSRKKKIGVREKAATGTRKKSVQIVKKSAWEVYNSSCKELQADIAEFGEARFQFVILHFCYSKKNATYLEIKEQMLHNVLEVNSYNGCIGGTLYPYDTDYHKYQLHLEKMKQNRILKSKLKTQK